MAGNIISAGRQHTKKGSSHQDCLHGQGEPFDNLDEVLVLTSEWGFAMSPRRITVSSNGIIPGLIRFLNECEAHLAISLHTPFHEERQ